MILSLLPFPYPCAVSMKLHPRSSALFSAATDSSSRCDPQLPPMAQAPNPISETFHPSLPNVLYFIHPNLNSSPPQRKLVDRSPQSGYFSLQRAARDLSEKNPA